jgi:hypothetical protein
MPVAAAGPLLVPWAVGHLIGAAVQLATLPLIVASAAVSSVGEPPPPYYGAPSYNEVPPAYYPPPGYYSPPTYYQPAGFYASPGPYHSASRYGAPPVYYAPAGSHSGFPGAPHGYSVAGMRYSAPYGAQVFRRSGGYTHRRW